MRIGELAANAAVSVQTLRDYARRGLLAEPARRRSGFREYEPGVVDRVRFIQHAQTFGFTLTEIGALLAHFIDRRGACASVEARSDATVARIDRRIAELTRMRRLLVQLAQACRRRARLLATAHSSRQ